MKTLLLPVFVFLFNTAYAQKSLTLTVRSENKQAIANASVTLREGAGKIMAKGITDPEGRLTLAIKTANSFTLEVSHIGYYPFTKTVSSKEISISELIYLKPDTSRLSEVTVVSNKPLIVMEPDRYVLNIDGKTSFGNTVTDILKKSPGINIANDQVTLEGKPVVVQLNGKTLPLSGKELLSFFSTSSAQGIHKIEMITTPPQGMDAGFTGGVINLQMKKLKSAGFAGRVSASVGYRSTYPKESINANLNFRKGIVNIFSSFGAYDDIQLSKMQQSRILINQALPVSVKENSHTKSLQDGIYQTTGIDLAISKRTILGLLVTTNANSGKNNIYNAADIFSNASIDSIYTMEQAVRRNGFNNFMNINLKSSLDTLGQEINLDIDYGQVNSKDRGAQDFGYLRADGTEYKNRYYVNQFSDNASKLFGVKMDYHKQIKNTSFDAGAKFANSAISYKLGEDRQVAGSQKVPITDTFHYDEKIAAGYFNLSGKINKWTLRGGIRAEYTRLSGKSITQNKEFSSDYFNLFPTISLSQQFDQKNSLSISYRRSISRPRFMQLNPFRYYTSPFYFFAGNPDLRPYYPSSIRVGYGYNNKIQADISWSFAKDKITEINTLPAGSNVTQSIKANNGKYNSIYSGISHYDNITKWWYSNTTVNLVHTAFTFSPDNAGSLTTFTNTSFSGYTSQRFTLPQSWIIELYSYASAATYYDATHSKPYWFADLTIYKEVLKGNGELSLGIKDIFYSNVTRSEMVYAKINTYLENRWDSREFTLGFSLRFGDKGVKANRQRNSTAVSEEKSRAR